MSNFETSRSAREAAEASLNTATDADRSTLEASAMAARNAEASAAAEQRAAQERAAQEKTYQEKATAEKAAQEKTKTEKVTAEKEAAQKAKQAKWGTYSERTVVKGVALWGNRRTIITEHKPTPKTDEARAANRAAEAAKARALQARTERLKQLQTDALKQRKVEQRQGMIEGIQGRKGVTPERVSAIHQEMQAQEKAKQAAAVPQNLAQSPAQSPDKSAQLSQIDAERQTMREQINEGKAQQQGKVSTAKDFAQKLVAEMKAKQPQQGQPGPQKGNSRRNEPGAGM